MSRRAGVRPGAALAVSAVLLAGCSQTTEPDAGPSAPPEPPSSTTSSSGPSTSPAPTIPPTTPPTTPPTAGPRPRLSPAALDPDIATGAVEHLAGVIGPRHGTSPAYRRAADWVQRRLEGYGWQVERQRFATPGGVSWGVPVDAGPSLNLVATPGDLRPGKPWLLVGAHLDTVPQAPGAEDNASGVGVLLTLAEALDGRRARLPVVLVAFGSEEPRGEGDDDHHFGSRAYVARLSAAERAGLRGMVALDRVGVTGPGGAVPVQTVTEANPLSDELTAAARRVGVPTLAEPFEASSDHESFHDAGVPAARLGSVPYAGYHSEGDVPSVVDPAQLGRVARILASWLR